MRLDEDVHYIGYVAKLKGRRVLASQYGPLSSLNLNHNPRASVTEL